MVTAALLNGKTTLMVNPFDPALLNAVAGPLIVLALTIITPLVLIMMAVGFSTARGHQKAADAARVDATNLQAQEENLLATHGPAPQQMKDAINDRYTQAARKAARWRRVGWAGVALTAATLVFGGFGMFRTSASLGMGGNPDLPRNAAPDGTKDATVMKERLTASLTSGSSDKYLRLTCDGSTPSLVGGGDLLWSTLRDPQVTFVPSAEGDTTLVPYTAKIKATSTVAGFDYTITWEPMVSKDATNIFCLQEYTLPAMKLTGAHDDPNPAPVKELSDVTEAGCGATEAALANSLAKGWLALNQITLSDGSDEDDHRADLLGLGMCAPGHQKALYDAFTSTKFVNLARVSDVSILGNRAVTVDPDVTVTGGAGVTSAVNWGPAASLDGTPVTRPRWTTTIRPNPTVPNHWVYAGDPITISEITR